MSPQEEALLDFLLGAWVLPIRPVELTVEAVRVLLVERGTPPAQGLWSVPGGKLEMNETLAPTSRCQRRARGSASCRSACGL